MAELIRSLDSPRVTGDPEGVLAHGVVADSRRVSPGDVFVAIRGSERDGHAYAEEAVSQCAAAVVASRPVSVKGVPVVEVADTRLALAELAAEWYGRPAQRVRLVGVTGSFGKTTVVSMLDATLREAGRKAGALGSEAVGIRLGGRIAAESRLTTPDALELQRWLAWMVAEGAEFVAVEVTSQGLEQNRIHGLTFDLGVFTTLAPLEHGDHHGTFREYVAAKSRFFEHMAPGAPLLYGADNLALRGLVRGRSAAAVGCGQGPDAGIRAESAELSATGTRLRLRVGDGVPDLYGGHVAAVALDLEVRLLGRPAVENATIAAGAALCMGLEAGAIGRALAEFPPPWRRIEMLYRGPFSVLDDTAGHPDSLTAVFDFVCRVRYERLHVVFAIRGQRGPELNRADMEALVVWLRRLPPATLVVTASRDGVEACDQVDAAEEAAALSALDASGLRYAFVEQLAEAVPLAMDRLGEGDLLVLLGAQGMDRGREHVAEWLRERKYPLERPLGLPRIERSHREGCGKPGQRSRIGSGPRPAESAEGGAGVRPAV